MPSEKIIFYYSWYITPLICLSFLVTALYSAMTSWIVTWIRYPFSSGDKRCWGVSYSIFQSETKL